MNLDAKNFLKFEFAKSKILAVVWKVIVLSCLIKRIIVHMQTTTYEAISKDWTWDAQVHIEDHCDLN